MPFQMNGTPLLRARELIANHIVPCSANSFQVSIKGAMTDVSSISSKIVYEEFCSRKVIPPTAQNKYKNEYPNLSFDWKKIYSLVFSVTLDTNLRAFQYKLLNRIVYTNDRLNKFKIVDTPLCAFCKNKNKNKNKKKTWF